MSIRRIAPAAIALAACAAAQAQQTTIIAAVVANYPPMEYKDPATGKLSGFDVEFGEALAVKAGATLRWEETSFDQMMAAVATGRVHIILSGMTDLAPRRDAVTFIDYLKTGPQFYALKERSADFPGMAALCGKKVGASRRTSFPVEIAKWSDDNCVKQGKPAITVVGTEGSADARTQLRQGRVDAAVQGGETLPYLMGQEPNTYLPIGKPIAYQYNGLAIDRKNEALIRQLSDAMTRLIADGGYAKIVARWGLGDFAVPRLIVNSAD